MSDDAAKSDDDCSVGTASTRSSMCIESDSDDGSDIDEEDNAYENSQDTDDEDDEEFRSHTKAADLSERARGALGEHLKAFQWNLQALTEDNTPVLQKPRPCSGAHALQQGVSNRFADPFQCFAECGGMTLQFVARLAANSNDCYWQHIL